MPEKIIIGISVENKIAKADKNAVIVCGNSNYKAVFAFDGEWENYNVKTALFATDKADNDGNGTIAVVFEGNECDIPPLENTTIVGVGVASGDLTQGEEVELATTTPAYIDCLLSIKDLGGVIAPPAPDVYDQIIALLNKYIQQGGGGSGGTDEERVREIVAEETSDLVAESDRDEFVKGGLTDNEETWTDEDKAKACKTIGAVKSNATKKVLYGNNSAGVQQDIVWAEEPNAYSIARRTASGKVKTTTPTEALDATNKAYVDIKANNLSTELAVINTVLEQSGLVAKYKATIEDTYNERVTADGENVLDGSKARLEKVVGSTVACRNLIPYPYADTTKTENGVTFTDNGDGTITLNGTATARTIFLLQRNKTDIILRQGSYIVISAEGSTTKAYIYLDMYVNGVLVSIDGTACGVVRKKQIQQNAVGMQLQLLVESGEIFNNLTIKPQIEYVDTEIATEYQPYFTGLKSASFAGIESTNADGTETSTLAFPKTPTPLGVTIDFENKKITNYGVDLVLTGAENWGYSKYSAYNGVLCIGICQPVSGEIANYVSTDSDQKSVNIHGSGAMWCGYRGSNIFYWLGILDILGFTTQGAEPTAEEKATAVANFKAYLAQRYADGNPVTIRYISSTLQSETDFTADNEYTAYKGGTEKVLDNDGKDYGADNTLSQNYIIVTGVK